MVPRDEKQNVERVCPAFTQQKSDGLVDYKEPVTHCSMQQNNALFHLNPKEHIKIRYNHATFPVKRQ